MKIEGFKGKVLMLGGSRLQVPAITAAQKLGFEVLCADYNPDAEGFLIADSHSVTSTLDIDALKQLAADEEVSYVITSTSDAPVYVAARVSEDLGLPSGISSEDAVCATQKDAMRERLLKHNVPMPRFRICDNPESFARALGTFDFNCIAKPADSAASRGVRLITEEDRDQDLASLFESFVRFSRKGVVMVEERIQGAEVSVEAMTVHGETKILTITDKLTTEPPYFVELGHSEPSRLSEKVQAQIRDITKRVISSIGIVDGPSHTEIMVTEEGPKVIETAARLGGDFITSKLVPLSTGIDFVKGSVAVALGEDFLFENSLAQGSAIRFITAELPGTISEIVIPEELCTQDGVEEVVLYLGVGDSISTPQSSNDRIGHVICSGIDAEDAILKADRILKSIKITVVSQGN